MNLHVCEVVKTLDVGGVEVLLVERLRQAPKVDKEYTVVCLRASTDELINRLRASRIRVVNLDRRPRLLAYAKLVTTIRRLRPDVINIHSPTPAIVLRPFVRFARKRPVLVSTVHFAHRPTSVFLDHLATSATVFFDRLTRRFDDLTIAVSSLVARSLAGSRGRRVLTRIHGVDVAELRYWAERSDTVRREFGVPDGAVLVVCVANFRPQKNHRLLIHAAQEVLKTRPDAVFLLAGDGPLREQVARDVEQRRLGDRVRVLGPVPQAKRLVAAADLVVLSSHYEGLPVVVMEALAAGVPVVSTRVGGVPELISSGQNGILTEPDSASAFCEAILDAMKPATLSRLRAGALASSETVDMGGTAEWFENLYEDLAMTQHT
ncbi:glycosyltransferase [Nonomuraea sp. SYSU D8015]|uniref:glycosyltransferase n=1 Tax=Nonomuraea sp. SYSU D8015 TaxID=2593644 RepID=UPI00166031D0|nr:glycosyltransferase [Nonomuraea sp. SYSU D8015]